MASERDETARERDEALRLAFNPQFGLDVQEVAVVRRLLGTPAVQGWYARYRATEAAARAVPPHLQAAGLTPAEWIGLQEGRRALKAAQTAYTAAVADAKQRYERTVVAAEARRLEAVEQAAPLVRATALTAEDLPVPARLRVGILEGRARKERVKLEVAWMIREAIKQARNGQLDLTQISAPDPNLLDRATASQAPGQSSGQSSGKQI